MTAGNRCTLGWEGVGSGGRCAGGPGARGKRRQYWAIALRVACGIAAVATVTAPRTTVAGGLVVEELPDSGGSATAAGGQGAVSPDGRFLAYVVGYEIILWDRTTLTTGVVSVDGLGNEANGECSHPAISSDGRYVAFESRANNLVGGDTNGVWDVFVHDTMTQTTTRVSVSSAGDQGNASSGGPAISADGRYVAFTSLASNLVTADSNMANDVFVRDRLLGTTERVSVSSSGVQGNLASIGAAISADGRYVAFSSAATNLVAADTNGRRDVFLRDRVAATTTRVSVGNLGVQANGDAGMYPALSADARYVGFRSSATNLIADSDGTPFKAFVRDRSAATTEWVSAPLPGTVCDPLKGDFCNHDTENDTVAVSDDGRFVTFDSRLPNLVAGDTNRQRDVFRRDRASGLTERVSVSPRGEQLRQGDSFAQALSGDGRHTIFVYTGPDLPTFVSSVCGDAVCGDGTIIIGCEQCDDLNTVDFDGCSSTCTLEPCHTCSGEPTVCSQHTNGTVCDDGNSCTPTTTCAAGRCVGTDTCLEALCPGGPDPCVVATKVVVPDQATVDLGGRALHLTSAAALDGGGGSFSLRHAASVTLDKGSALRTLAKGTAAGTISLDSVGTCVLGGKIQANGIGDVANASGGDGGAIEIACSDIMLGSSAICICRLQ